MIIKELQKFTTKIVYIGALMLTSCGESGEFVYNNLSENKILFTTRTVEGWTGQQAKSRAVLENNEKEPIIVKTNMSTPLYLHPVTQIGTHIQTANNIPITKSGKVIIDESTGKVIPTRGTPNISSSIGSSFGLLAYRSASSATDLNGIAPDFINNQQVTTSGSLWKTNTDYFWPDDGDKLSFFAYTPFGDNNVTVSSASSTGTPSITYTANTDVTKQPDLMVAKALEQCMRDIIQRYPCNDSTYLLPIVNSNKDNERTQYRSRQRAINNNLKKIAKELGLDCNLTMYVARHSWASAALDIEIPIEVISDGMGHTSEKTTRIYLKSMDNRRIDFANERIISAVE